MQRNNMTVLILVALIIAAALLAQVTGIRLYERIATTMFISMVLGLQVFMGNSSILSFAHIGFMGVNAYISGCCQYPDRMKGMALPDLYPVLENVVPGIENHVSITRSSSCGSMRRVCRAICPSLSSSDGTVETTIIRFTGEGR